MRKAIHILLASWFLLACYGIADTNTNDMGVLILDAPDFAVWGKRLPFEIELSWSQKRMYPGIPDGIPIHTYRLLIVPKTEHGRSYAAFIGMNSTNAPLRGPLFFVNRDSPLGDKTDLACPDADIPLIRLTFSGTNATLPRYTLRLSNIVETITEQAVGGDSVKAADGLH